MTRINGDSMSIFAVMEYQGDCVETELSRDDCLDCNGFPVLESNSDPENRTIVRACHFRAFNSDATAGFIVPVDAEHPANARLVWTWKESDYKKPAGTFSAEFPEGVL